VSQTYTIEVTDLFQESMKNQKTYNRLFIYAWYLKNLKEGTNPRSIGKEISGPVRNQWQYRIGDKRILAHIDDEKQKVILLDVVDSHSSEDQAGVNNENNKNIR